MRDAWTLTMVRMRLATRNRIFLFFSLFVPLIFLFTFLGIGSRWGAAFIPYLLASVLTLTVMGSFWGLSVQLVTFREHGILRRFQLAPVGAGAMLASSLISNYIMTLPTIVIEFVVARWVFHMSDWGNIWGVFLMISFGIVTFASMGLTIASVTNTMQETQIINQVLWSALFFLSGATIPLPMLPGWVQRFAVFLPATYLVTGLQRVLVGRVGVAQVGAELTALAICSCIAFIVSQQLFRWDAETKVSRRAKLLAASTIIPFLLLGIWESSVGHLRSNAQIDFFTVNERSAPAPEPPPITLPPQ